MGAACPQLARFGVRQESWQRIGGASLPRGKALHPDKTRLIRFGRHAAKQRQERGEGKPETFDFLGFTHFCTRSRKWGSFVIGRKTIKKRMVRVLLAIKMELRRRMHDPPTLTGVDCLVRSLGGSG
jgi:hypothetical protein